MSEQQDRQARLLRQLKAVQRKGNENTEALLQQMVELLQQMLEQQAVLIEALADGGAEDDAPPRHYMDGSPIG